MAVIGGGISGLAAAWELTGGAGGPGPESPDVVVLDAAAITGGKLATAAIDGHPVDVGPDGFLGRRPEAAQLCREVGLGNDLVPIGASGAAIWARGRRRPLPAGLFLGVPTRVGSVLRSGILSPAGALRLLVDVVAPRPDRRGPLGDRAIGPLVSRKLGQQVVERLVEPLLGGIHAGGVADASAAAIFPALLSVSQGRAGFMRALRRLSAPHAARGAGADGAGGGGAGGGGGGGGGGGAGGGDDGGDDEVPAFWTLRGGLASLSGRITELLVARGASVRTGARITALEREDGRWAVRGDAGTVHADGIVIALPAGPAAELLSPLDADAAAILAGIDYASVTVVTLVYPADAVPDDLFGTGLLVPRGTRVPPVAGEDRRAPGGRDETCLVTACTYLWAKWPHLDRPGTKVLRASVGRFGDDRAAAMGDDELVARVSGELAGLLGMRGAPVESLVSRSKDALPQYRVHHLLRVGSVEAAVKRLGAVAPAGAAYRGVGIPACIASGRAAARDVVSQLALAPSVSP